MAATLHLIPATVKFHLARVFRKLGVHTRGEAAAVAHEFSLVGRP
ncbi:LuxR C-terminal-related transcriptional regulator [Amycolatopsis sp. FDAARGOS 1241]|nr:LuxR C-terminal-related transcriptional regulator [Amycolatopsis sp. FDAARGOS 1241]